MPTSNLPENPSLENLKKRAKGLLKSIQAGESESRSEVKEFHPRREAALSDFALNDAQVVVARSYGFTNWARLKEYVARVSDFAWNPPTGNSAAAKAKNPFEEFIHYSCLAYDGSWCPPFAERARKILREHPEFSRDSIYGAATVGDVEAARSLIANDKSILNQRGGPFGWEPLLYVCYSRLNSTETVHSTLEVARIFLEAGADPNAGFLWHGLVPPFTALTGAFGNGEAGTNEPPHQYRQELARLLLDGGADPNDGQTLYNCHFGPNDDHLRLLFEYGLGQDKKGPWYQRFGERLSSPSRLLVEELWAAARKGFMDRVKLLVEHGAELSVPGSRDGRTPYEVAVRAGHTEIAEYLLRHGAKKVALSIEERFGAACIEGNRGEAFALLQQQPDLADKLGHHGRVELLHRAVEARRPEGVRLMAKLGFELKDVTRHDGVGLNLAATPMHNAAWIGDLEMVKLLIELGADPTIRDPNYNSTPLGWAVYNRQQHVAEYLSHFGTIFEAVRGDNLERARSLLREDSSSAKSVDNLGYPLLFYVDSNGRHLSEMVRLLVEHGADLNMISRDGRTALDYAIERGNENVANLLRVLGAKNAKEPSNT